MKGVCAICGKWCDVEKHHIFGGANRDKSETYGLCVYLCNAHHTQHPDGVHRNNELMDRLHRYGQEKAMKEQGWNADEFRGVFGKNYI